MERAETLRRQIMDELESTQEPLSIRELSQLLGISEKDILSHLEHIEKTLRNSKEKLLKKPSYCRKCGFEFGKRKDFKRPSRCPSCRSEYISPPLLYIGSR